MMLYAIIIIVQPIIHPIWIVQYLPCIFPSATTAFSSPSCSCPWHTFDRFPAPRSAPAAARSSPVASVPPCPAPADRRRAATRSPTGPDREPEGPHPIHGDLTNRKRENHSNFTRNVGIYIQPLAKMRIES